MSQTAAPKKIWTILELITWGTEYLTEKSIDDARLTIELLLAHVLQFQRIQLYTKFDQPLTDQELAQFKELLKRRLTREPLQYILGDTEFMGLKFRVDKRVLIPRPETELLVEKSIELLHQKFSNETIISILDIGTGSGCIAVSVAKMIPNAQITAIDVSKEALELAQQNAEQHGVAERILFQQSDLFNVTSQPFAQKFHCILSNPPYISQKEFELVSNDVKNFEPNSALTDNGNGLKFYTVIAHLAEDLLIEQGIVGVEHAYDQSESVQTIFTHCGFSNPIIVKDYQGIQRHLFYIATKQSS
ncbi:MAG: peptide chain release factor N(5)-glutamine methyltransferase [Bacteroidota bacterium]